MTAASRLVSFVVLGIASVTLAACPQPPTEDTRLAFASLTPAARAAIVTDVLDLTGERAANLVTLAEIDHAADASCPTRTTSGDTVVYQASKCTGAASGVRWSGRLEAENSPRTDRLGARYDFSRPEELRFFDWHADRPDAPLVVDGVLRYSPGAALGETLVDNHLARAAGETVSLDLRASCIARGTARECRALPGSSAACASDGAGGDFEVSATLRLDGGQVSGTLLLGGIDELRLDTERRDADACLVYVVAGAPGSVCLAELAADDATSVGRLSWRCDDAGALHLASSARGAPVFAKVELRRGHAQQQIELAPVSHDETSGSDRFESAATPVSVVGDLGCAEMVNVAARVVAVFADGTTACYVNGSGDEFDAQACF